MIGECSDCAGSDEEFWVRFASHPNQRKVWIRIIDRERAEIRGEGDEKPKPISLYEAWMTDRNDGLSPTDKHLTPWGDTA